MKWKRHNIAATMEPFEPSASVGRAMEHVYQQIEDSPRSMYEASAGPSRPPPPNSIRALLMTASRNSLYRMSPAMRHVYTTRYGTQENIYEEISSEERLRLLSGGHSMMSLHQPSTVEEEFRRVQNRHRRVLGELNLSVEAMLMPSTPPSESPVAEAAAADEAGAAGPSKEQCVDDLVAAGVTDELLSPTSAHASHANADIDSGFSGSSSSGNASCLGSLRFRSGMTVRSATPNGHCGGGGCRSSHRSNEDPGILMVSPHSPAVYGQTGNGATTFSVGSRFRSAEDPGPAGSCADKAATLGKASFWSRKGWRKFSAFSSNATVSKSAANSGKFNSIFSCDV